MRFDAFNAMQMCADKLRWRKEFGVNMILEGFEFDQHPRPPLVAQARPPLRRPWCQAPPLLQRLLLHRSLSLLVFVPASWLRRQQYEMLSLAGLLPVYHVHATNITYLCIYPRNHVPSRFFHIFVPYRFYCRVVEIDDHVNA